MSPRRLVLALALAVAAAVMVVPGAGAGNFDESRMGCTGEDPATCPAGRVGEAYSLPVRLQGDEDLGCAVFSVSSGSFPPGLTLTPYANETKAGLISGTPTQTGNFEFYLRVAYTKEASCLPKPTSEDRFVIPINPEIPKLTIGPEQPEVPHSTVGQQFTLQMTATVSDAKAWTISAGQLPPGVTLGSSDGLISGIPTTAGTYDFTVQAVITPDALKNPPRTDTKSLQVVVRDPLTITPPETVATSRVQSEVSVDLSGEFTLAGGSGTYTWSPVAGTLPPGVRFSNGTLTGSPRTSGRYTLSVSATDSEGRIATYAAAIVVAPKVTITRPKPAPAKVGRLWKLKLRATGGVLPKVWKLTKGPLPKGVKFNKALGLFAGKPVKPGRYPITVELTDALGVKSTLTFLIRVSPAPKKPAPKTS